MATAQRVVLDGESTTWTVTDQHHALAVPVETYLEYCRQLQFRPNTIRSYAHGLSQWWTFLEQSGTDWDNVVIHDFGDFVAALRYGELTAQVRQLRPTRVVSDATINVRLRAVMSFYRYHADCGVDAAPFLWKQSQMRSGPYLSFLEHVARRTPQKRATVRIRQRPRRVPILTPHCVDSLMGAEASFSPETGEWQGDLRYRLLWALLAETGMRIGEALSLQHRDWCTDLGAESTQVRITPRAHPHGLSGKSGARNIHVGARLDRLYGDYIWWLCDRGADAAVDDWDSSYIFCNISRAPLFAPLRPESVYAHLKRMKQQVDGLPQQMTPHWFRHTHATALLLSGTPTHVVSRRLGHTSVQTTMNIYGHVTDDAELAALANWRDYVAGWEYPNE